MISRREKRLRALVVAISEKAKLSTFKGLFEIGFKRKPTRKNRKHSGRYTPRIDHKGKYSEMIANAEEPQEEFNEWGNYRDGFRDEEHLKWKKIGKTKNGWKKNNK